MNQEIDTSLLPGVLREMSEIIGIPATMAIVQEYGGIRLYVPMKLTHDHQLIKLVGKENAEKLVDRFGGEVHFDIPLAEAALRQIRDTEIRKSWPSLSQSQLAIKYRTTERHIRRILAGCEQDNDQLELF